MLERLDGSGAIATSKRDVLSAVEERSGFTFDEFRRSVLLAQGEFDVFLLADEGKRADLLEKITGTEIYSRISMRVFEDTAERERALEALMQQQTAIGVMPEDEREALLAEQQQKIVERATQAEACEQLARRTEAWRRHRKGAEWNCDCAIGAPGSRGRMGGGKRGTRAFAAARYRHAVAR